MLTSRLGARTVAECVAARSDNFLLLRFLAAALVIFGHCWALAVNPTQVTDWLGQRTRVFSGTVAVEIFFLVSGFLVTMSYARRHSLWQFVKARTLRIFPALIACVLWCTFVLGLALTKLPFGQYLGDPATRRYVLGNASLLNLQWSLPGVFEDHSKTAVNGSLWTLPGELQMYGYVALFGLLGAFALRRRFAWLLGALLVTALFFPGHLPLVSQAEFYPLAAFFAFGACCWMYRERIVVSGFIALALLFACGVFYDQSGYPWVFAAATAYTALWFVFAPGMQWFNRFGDYSYGLYLYGYPSQQLVAHWFPQFGPWRMAALALPLALCCAIASWHCVEKPFLRLK